MIRSASLALSLMLGSVIVGTATAAEQIAPERVQELQNLLIQDCGSCHGLQMRGGLGPALLPEKLQTRPTGYISSVILNGLPGTAMPPWSSLLSATEADWIANRLRRGEWQ